MLADYVSRRAYALERCDALYKAQARYATIARWLYHLCQGVAIVAGIAAPVVILVVPDGTNGFGPKLAKAITAAAGSLALGLLNQFGWRNDWSRQTAAASALDSERVKFRTLADPYPKDDPEGALTRFVSRTEAINKRELSEFLEQEEARMASERTSQGKRETRGL